MESVVTFLKDHWVEIMAVYGGLVAVATTIVKLTPSTKDDEILAKIIKVLDFFSTVNPKKLTADGPAAAHK